VVKGVGIALLVIGLAACGAPRPHPSAPPPAQSPNQPAAILALPAPGGYRIDTGNSELRLLVYRAGPLASLGHNHVMVNRSLSGTLLLGDTLPASSLSLDVPVKNFVVDDAAARREEGDEFSAAVPEDARAGTLRNMLSPAVLNAAEFPVISVRSVSLGGTSPVLTAVLTINVAGHESNVTAPFTLDSESHQLRATGSFVLRQTALGLTPLSLMLGALQVQDAMRLKFKIVAVVN
jgi:hypothetical protein